MLTNDYLESGRSQRESGDEEQVISLQWLSPTHPLSRLDYMTLCNNTEIIEVPFFPIDPIIVLYYPSFNVVSICMIYIFLLYLHQSS